MVTNKAQSQLELRENFNSFISFAAKTEKEGWAVIVENEVVAQGNDLKKLLKNVKKEYPDKRPLISRVNLKTIIL